MKKVNWFLVFLLLICLFGCKTPVKEETVVVNININETNNDTTNDNKNEIKNETMPPEENVYKEGSFENESQRARNNFGVSNLTLRKDGTFTLSEVCGMGAVKINGLFGQEGDVLMFSDFDANLYNIHGEEVHNFEFRIVDDNTLELMRDLEGSTIGDCFSSNGLIPENYKSEFYIKEAVYVHEPIDDVFEEYLPRIELHKDKTFTFTENCYAGLGEYKGSYTYNGSLVLLKVDDNFSMQGFAGGDVKLIELEITSDGFILHTDLCMSCKSDQFIMQ